MARALTDYQFVEDGLRCLPDTFDAQRSRALLAAVRASRDFSDLFLTEAQFRAAPLHKGVNPRPGRNLIEKLETEFIFGNPTFIAEMTRVCGDRWRVLDYKFVMGVPQRDVPPWLQHELGDRLVANLGAYVKPQFRDITYFRGIDYHQDIIDFPDRESDFITAYIYLDDVDAYSSPLYVLPRSFLLGPSIFPHKLERRAEGSYLYANDYGETLDTAPQRLTGGPGALFYWHSSTLHGTQPHANDTPRISVRILVERNARACLGCELDRANARLSRPLVLATTRRDLDEAGKAVLSGNEINKA